jgi:PAS domain S-box-containing protein
MSAPARMKRVFHSIRFQLPATLLVLGVAMLAIAYAVLLPRIDRSVFDRRADALRTAAVAAGELLSAQRARGDVEAVQELVARLPALWYVQYGALVEADGRISASTLPEWRGKRLEETPAGAEASLVRLAIRTNSIAMKQVPNRRLLFAVPVRGPALDSGDAAAGRGAFLLDYDVRRAIAVTHTLATRYFALVSAVVLVGLLLMSLYLHRRVAAPALRLAAAADRYAAGDRTARAGLSGSDEVRRAAEAFDRLAQQLDDNDRERARQRRLLDTLLTSLPVGVMAVSRDDGRVLFSNPHWRELSGLDLRPGMSHHDAMSTFGFRRPDGSPLPESDRPTQLVLGTGRPSGLIDMVVEHPDGRRTRLVASATPVPIEGDRDFDAVVTVVQDRRDLEEVFAELRRSERELQALLDSITVGVLMLTRADRKLLFSNRRMQELCGHVFRPGDVVPQGPVNFALLRPDGRPYPDAELTIMQVLRTGRLAVLPEAILLRSDGERVPVHIVTSPVSISGGEEFDAVVAVVQDRRDLERAFEEVRAWERRFESVSEATGQAIYEWQMNEDTVRFSASLERVFGYRSEDVNTNEKWGALTHPDDLPAVIAAMKTCVRDRSTFDVVYRFRHRDGRWLWVRDRGLLSFDEAGRFVRLVGAVADITRQHEMESQLRQAQKMETVGTLAGGIAHDFNNQLTGVLGHLGLLIEELPPQDPRLEHARVACVAAERCVDLTRGLLAFSRMLRSDPRPTGVNATIEETAALLRRMLPATIRFELDLAPDLPPAMVDPTQLQQVILNLCVNARDAMPEGGTLRVASRPIRLSAEQPRAASSTPGRYVQIEVGDTGVGIAPEVLPRIFEPFFTTKPIGSGTGLGLSMVYGIVTQHGGWVEVDSAPGRGARFRVCLPAAERTGAMAEAPIASAAPARGLEQRTVLIVDDESVVRTYAKRALESAGCRVLSAEDGDHALQVLGANEGEISAVLMDLTMPGSPVRFVVRRMLDMRPDLRVVLTSGFSVDTPSLDEMPALPFLPKPYSPQQLLDALRAALEADPAGSGAAV